MTRSSCVVLSAWLCVGASAISSAQEPTLLALGHTVRLESRVLGETRLLDVTLPRGYESGTGRFPVLVVLDGESEHEIAAAIARFYATMSQLPPVIVVGVRNTNRTRDMTPAPVAGFMVPPEAGDAGGADKFLDFIADELIPYVNRTYRAEPMRVLVGHSLGGLFALHALARRPSLFIGYVVMEPSAWWNNGRELRAARETLRLPAAGGGRARVMMVNTEPLGVDTTAWGGTRPMVRHLETSGETHASMAAAGLMGALRTMFADFRPMSWRPGTRPIAMLDRYDSLEARVGYPVPIPRNAYSLVVRMSLDSRHFDDAEYALAKWEAALGPSAEVQEFRARLASDRSAPAPANFIPLEIPVRRASPRDASAFLGRWVLVDDSLAHQIDVRASGDTIVVRDRIRFLNGQIDEGERQVIQVASDGTLEWGLPWFRGIAALVVLRGRILEDGTMRVSREPRGWVPRGPSGDFSRVQRFRRVVADNVPAKPECAAQK